MKDKFMIKDYGLFTTLVASMVGIGLFYGPSFVARIVEQDSWISCILMTIFLFIVLYMIHSLIKMNDYQGIVVILRNTYGRFWGNLIALAYSIAMIIVLSVSLRSFADVVKIFLLPKTELEVVIVLIIFVGIYLVRGGLANLVYFNEIIFFLLFIPVTIILLLAIPTADFQRILPVFTHTPTEYMKSVFELFFLVNGFCIAFVLLPLVENKKNINKILRRSTIFIGVFYTITIILVTANLSVAQTAERIFPTITMLRSINVRSGVLERWDGLVMALWVLFYYATFVSTYYFSTHMVKDIFNIEDIKIAAIIYIPLVYAMSLYPENMAQIYTAGLGPFKIIFGVALIIVIFLSYFINLIKKKRSA
ncbi:MULTISPECIES: endospore germination permease [Clostridium]|uniref:Endospore germination permease n=1 Tax=Clostridium senegalense TaxID=1465809 RepID=A0A6M0H354_9CLOT|nr:MULTISPECIES: endospore germination permease [Clostridium]NEU04062.1 endospore germination permease [Clostridium senegalense]